MDRIATLSPATKLESHNMLLEEFRFSHGSEFSFGLNLTSYVIGKFSSDSRSETRILWSLDGFLSVLVPLSCVIAIYPRRPGARPCAFMFKTDMACLTTEVGNLSAVFSPRVRFVFRIEVNDNQQIPNSQRNLNWKPDD
jgi:hypothetical protein